MTNYKTVVLTKPIHGDFLVDRYKEYIFTTKEIRVTKQLNFNLLP
ncbi:hypothetical protein CLW00_103178 [Mongoliibacter ruber]|uniref:Uncharacterized protein n=1 Tax=Mongoliibacter ruber TaxID=1750599 RepID=A0A2T0WQV4_9BACT|nr:hypothetical protein CLW00_103178 [Mongoliibacter ruber]